MNTTPQSSWIHPIHARGVPSRTYDATVKGPLTDTQIFRYALEGFYGEAAQRAAESKVEYDKERTKATKAKESLVKSILREIDSGT